ncbi:MAG TPA: hypothetical protein VIK01_09420 [Polyangiaceae bacterium]
MLGFGASRPAEAQERGAIGVELSAGLGAVPRTSDNVYQPNVMLRDGLSVWYRLMPALAIGLNVGAMQNGQLDGVNFSRDTFVASGKVVETFAEGRLFPTSFVGAFGRVSAGLASLDLVPTFVPGPSHEEAADEPILELEGGPELRIFFSPPSARPRSDLLLRVRGTVTAMPAATFLGYGLALGFEG